MSSLRSFKVVIAQINPIVGDFEGNLKKHTDAIKSAKAMGARVVVFSELSLVGYMPKDVLLEPFFLQKHNQFLHRLTESIDDIYVVVGAVTKNPTGVEKPFFNSALVLHNQKIIHQYDKKLLPTYNVFDERRYFERGSKTGYLEIEGIKIGLSICEDMWQHGHSVSNISTCYNIDPIEEFKDHALDLLINLSASPYYQNKLELRRKILHSITKALHAPMMYVNQVGGNDGIVYDGYSMFVSASGEVRYAKGYDADLKMIDLYEPHTLEKTPDFSEDLEKALCLGIKDYVEKNGFHKVVLGLSGGIDSALTLALCVKALGKDHVKALYMPSVHSSPLSLEIALKIAHAFGVSFDVIPINHIMNAYTDSLDNQLALSLGGIAFENIQSRIRGNIIMAYANKHAAMMMGCSNKSELAVGYGTLYGDIAGGLLPIGDLYKCEVYKLAHKLGAGTFPEEVYSRAPSAELYMNQKDTDSLPPYEILDPILHLYLELGLSKEEILKNHSEFEPYIDYIFYLLKVSEFKRYQAPMILKVSKRNFGLGWDFPITRR